MNSIDISWTGLLLGSLLLIIPIAILLKYKTGLVKSTAFAFLRMGVQLALIGLYLKYIFEINSIVINLLWVAVMAVAAAFTIVSRSELKQRFFFIPILSAIIVSVMINGCVFAFIVIGTDSFFNARYIIPIAGMLIGNCLGSAIIGIRAFYSSLARDEERYKYSLMSGASQNEALFPFISNALKEAFNPFIANTASIGLIWLPGMMTGQILGGNSPETAIKYQIIIIIGIFAGSVINVFLSIYGSKRLIFNEFNMLDSSFSEKQR